MAFLASYQLDAADLANLDKGNPITGLLSKVRFTPLDEFDLSDIGAEVHSGNVYNDPGYTGILYWFEGKCWRIDHVAADLSSFTIVPCPNCGCTHPGGGTGEGSTGNNNTPGALQQQYLAIVDLIGGSSGSSSGGPGSPGSGGGTPYIPRAGFYSPFNPVKPSEVDPMEPQDEDFYHPQPIIGVVSPNLIVEDPHEKNCEELKKMLENQAIKNKIISLQNAANDSNKKNEEGYALKHPASSNNTTLTPEPLEPTSTSLGAAVKIKYGSGYYGALHDHPFPDPTDPNRIIPMFSVSDMYNFGNIVLKYNNGISKDYNKFVFTLSVKGGSEGSQTSTYALKIENWIQFSGNFMTTYFNMSDDDKKSFGADLAKKYTDIEKNTANLGPMQYMKVLFKFMQTNNIRGVAIYKANDNLTQWEKQVFNPADNTITSQPCP
ncbi:hypothetical protein [Flavobacterium sp.]|uniref:hypothetical protein n=1 Tax=Flavobacterium sp. TaxID=239 RepID=UPI0040339306